MKGKQKMKLTQTNRQTANMLTKNFTTMGDFTHIISICCPDDNSIKPINENHLVIKMWDVDEVLENQFRKYEPPCLIDCHYIINRINEWVMKDGWNINILIHCDAGISRSAAIALGIVWDLSLFFFTADNNVIVHNYIWDTNWGRQILYDVRANTIFSRQKNNGNWTNWCKITTTDVN